ncbi:MAG: isochorismatase family protein [Armatimonadetes bacterium]|nr:isochorismatase family protein [Armatimonadota bacterium]
MLRFTGRYYRTIPNDQTGYDEETVELDPARTALIGMHCWNIGCEEGPAVDPNFCVGMGYPEATAEAGRIMQECIRPAMDAARTVGILVCHVEAESIARLHPESLEDVDPVVETAPCSSSVAVTGWREEMVARFHGADYATKSPYARMDRARAVDPLPGEPYIFQTGQFDRALRRHGIENLIYTGFATDMCILRAPGGIEPMAGYGYRLFLMRDATIGVECPDTFEERIATRWALRYFETHFGDTLLLGDFLKACGESTKGAG